MRHPIPPIREAVAALKERLPHEHEGPKQPRRQRRDLLASGQARTRQDVARLLGVQRNTVSPWLAVYAAGGLPALLATYVPRGNPVSLAPEGPARRQQARRRPEGCASSEALRQGVRRTPGVAGKDKTLHPIVRTRFRPTRKGPRPSPTTNS